jgi:outer membrane protein OmpA-like peptidoglycan-associated protein
MKLLISLSVTFLFLFSTLTAEIYDETTYSQNYFYDTHFDEIIRFGPLMFKSGSLSDESDKYLQKIIKKIKTYSHGTRKIRVTIIGHTCATTDDANERKLESKSYAKKLQNYFGNRFDTNESFTESEKYATKIQELLIDEGIDENITTLELRLDRDLLFTLETKDSNEASNRVLVSMYVESDLDMDRDGVLVNEDNCPNSKPGVKVDKNGCSYKTIVLLLKSDKKHNEIEIKTKAGSSSIENAYDYTLLKSERSLPKVLSKMSDAEIKKLFGNVLLGANHKLVKFIVYFDGIHIVADSEKKLLNIIDVISKTEDAYIQVIGHTDTRGEKESNEILAKKRADIVARKIKDATNSYLYMAVESYGEYNLALKTADEVREPLNKRVEILIR